MARVRGGATLEAPAQNDAYVGMLIISLVAMLIGCVFLYLDYADYPDKAPTPPAYTPPARPAAAEPGV